MGKCVWALEIAQTSAARVSVVIARADLNQLPAFRLLVDRTSAQYLRNELLHAAQEYDGRPIGTEALCQAAAQTDPR
jgi:glycine cleavage system aminomethyltransferase T